MADADLLTGRAKVLVCIAREPGIRLSRLVELVGVTERTVSRHLNDLEAAGYITRGGRPNLRDYSANRGAQVNEHLIDVPLRALLDALNADS